MKPTTTSTNPIWTAVHTELFSACKDMFTINPSTGEVEQKNDKAVMENLMRTIARITMGEKKEEQHQCAYNSSNAASGLKQIVIWPGGKKNELKNILANVPSYDRFFEPFVGGGSVFMGINAREHYINDFSTTQINLYKNIATSNKQFYHYLTALDMSIVKAGEFAHRHQAVLVNIYEQYRTDVISKKDMEKLVSEWCDRNKSEILDIIGEFTSFPCTLVQELKDYTCGSRGRFIKMKKRGTVGDWVNKNIETAVKGALHNYYRSLYNNKVIESTNLPLHSALWVYLRTFAFSGMLTYNKKGDYTTSYGGSKMSAKRLYKELSYYQSERVREHFQNASIYNYDFEEFLLKTNPTENDFIFLDPPYDCVFSAYDNNEFNRNDHKRLANYLMTRCKAKWMMIIGKTDFIYDLYNQPGIYIQEYDKKYSCNAKNNKNREVVHLLITNYDTHEAGSYTIDNVIMEHNLAA